MKAFFIFITLDYYRLFILVYTIPIVKVIRNENQEQISPSCPEKQEGEI